MKCLSYGSLEEQAIHWQHTKQQLRCTTVSIKTCQLLWKPGQTSVRSGTLTETQRYSRAAPCVTGLSAPAVMGQRHLFPHNRELSCIIVSETSWAPYRTLSLRVAIAVCRASSFSASQAGGDPFLSSSFTASTAPSIMPTADLYCSSEGGWHARFARGCRFK